GDVDPGTPLGVEDGAEPADAILGVDAEPRLPLDLDPIVAVDPRGAALLTRGGLAHCGCRSRYERTKGHTGIMLMPRSSRSASAAATMASPRPWPLKRGSTSVWISVTAPFRRE